MIRESFLKAVNTLRQAHVYSPEDVDRLIALCNKVGVSHSQSELLKMHRLCGNIVHSIPDREYILHRDIVYDFSEALVELGKRHKRIVQYFDGFTFDQTKFTFKKYMQFGDPHIFAISLYLNLAVRLEDLGLPGEAFNALIKSLDPWVRLYNKTTGEGDLEATNITLFDHFLLGAIVFGAEENRKTFIGRSALCFRLSKILGMNNHFRGFYLKDKKFLKLGNESAYEDILFSTNYLEMISMEQKKHKDFDESVSILTNQFEIEKSKNDHDTSFLIAFTLAKVLRSEEWAKKALACSPSTYYWAEVLYLETLIACSLRTHSEYMSLIQTFLTQAKEIYPDRMMFELCKQKNSDIINLIVMTCISVREYQLAVELIYTWWASKPGDAIFPCASGKNILVSLPNFNLNGGHFFIYNHDKVAFLGSPSEKTLSDIFTLKDKVESSWTVLLNHQEDSTFNNDFRNYVELSQEYIESLSEYIGLEIVTNLLNDFPENTHFEYLELSWLNTPILPLIVNSTKNTYSVSLGTSTVSESKEIKKALIWSDPDGSLPTSSFEVEALMNIFTKHGIDFEIYEGTQCTKTLFLEKYSDPEFDLIWIISHGEFNSDNPPFSLLHVSESEQVTAWELQERTPSEGNSRYLILNACQSGAAGTRFNSMGFLGIGPAITNEFQKVLGHLWVVDSLASAVLGTLTLNSLLEGNSLSFSLKNASNIMSKGNQIIAENICNISPDLQIIDRVQNAVTKDLSLPFYSMSALVFE
ncbi:CHAT domain-containing protein [Bacillus cereus group sp. TH204-1LC]|uniref:CHAT domain-containing protein n=1 Tax=unclassified Bacillus cereus group TaxID=2750818 RepID=UPI0022E5A5CD|nr:MULTISPECIES: CHAT domain-containing protein [unclassified Bacillus cereus group]MDA1617281.1 CHAT domain-containing protein [Bacillus cereus group sp. TH204-1LC]MDX5882022.1 CHAT domain-containing protein [Bacillus cereus group sp. BfR-BA-00999]